MDSENTTAVKTARVASLGRSVRPWRLPLGEDALVSRIP